jgi:hypothetical protein
VGFEPTVPLAEDNALAGRPIRPLWHLSWESASYVQWLSLATVQSREGGSTDPPGCAKRGSPTLCDAVVTQHTSSASVPTTRPRRAPLWSQVLLIAWLYWLYDVTNNLAATRESTAFSNGRHLLKLEKWLQLDHELSLNSWVSGHDTIGLVLADYYDVMHLALTFVMICVLWWARPDVYRQLRLPLVLTNVVGFIVFWLYPVAPPRMLAGYVDTVSVTNAIGSWHSGQLAQAANEFAAMPSLHVAWACWVYIAIRRAWPDSPLATAAAVGHVALTVLCVVATANHYVLDVVAGAATAAVCFAAWHLFVMFRQRRSTGSDGGEPSFTS